MHMKSDRKYQIIPYPSEYVVADGEGNKIVACPTEQEAWEYITEVLQGELLFSSFDNRRPCERKNRSHGKNAIQLHFSDNDILGDDYEY